MSSIYSWDQVKGLLAILQTVVELFLGLRLKTYFPSARLPYTDSFPRGEGSDEEDSETDDPAFSAASSKVNAPFNASAHPSEMLLLLPQHLLSKLSWGTVRNT